LTAARILAGWPWPAGFAPRVAGSSPSRWLAIAAAVLHAVQLTAAFLAVVSLR
jgi:hypothetical protein